MSWPEPPDWLRLEVEPLRLARGGTVTVAFDAPHDRIAEYPRELGLGCLAHEAKATRRGEGRFRLDRQHLVHDDWRPVTGPETFEFTVPEDAPYSYEGEVVSFYWGIWLRRERRVLDREAYVAVVVDP